MLGVRRKGFWLVSICAPLCCIGSFGPAGGGELSNILFPPVQKQSREASADALDAISTALKGIAELERNKPENSQKLLEESAGRLKHAAEQMEIILSKADSDQQFKRYLAQEVNTKEVSKDSWEWLVKYFEKDKLSIPKNRGEAFALFIKKTRILSASLDKPEQRLNDLGDYLKLGDLVARLLRQGERN